MGSRSFSDKFAAFVVVVLIILTALGNALVTFLVALVLLVAGLLLFCKQGVTQGGILAATVGSILAILIALILLLR